MFRVLPVVLLVWMLTACASSRPTVDRSIGPVILEPRPSPALLEPCRFPRLQISSSEIMTRGDVVLSFSEVDKALAECSERYDRLRESIGAEPFSR